MSIRATIKYAIMVKKCGLSAPIVGLMRSESNKLQILLIQKTALRGKIAFSSITLLRSIDKSIYGIAILLIESFIPDSYQQYPVAWPACRFSPAIQISNYHYSFL